MRLPMPGHKLPDRPIAPVCGQQILLAGARPEPVRRLARLVETIRPHQHPVFVADGPETTIEQPVRRLGQRDAVGWVIRPAALELMDVRGVHRGLSVHGGHAIAGRDAQGLSVVYS